MNGRILNAAESGTQARLCELIEERNRLNEEITETRRLLSEISSARYHERALLYYETEQRPDADVA